MSDTINFLLLIFLTQSFFFFDNVSSNSVFNILGDTRVILKGTAFEKKWCLHKTLYLKLIHVGDFKKTEEVMSTMYQYSSSVVEGICPS